MIAGTASATGYSVAQAAAATKRPPPTVRQAKAERDVGEQIERRAAAQGERRHGG
jgi:hypothetical protein